MKRFNYIYVVATVVAATFFYHSAASAQQSNSLSREVRREVRREAKKYGEFLRLVATHHLDTLDYGVLTEAAINGVLDLCDPHSQYLPKSMNEALSQEIESIPIRRCYVVNDESICIELSLFARNSAEMIMFNYTKMGSPKTLLLDLRGNKGGLVNEAIKCAELFLKKDDLIFTREGRSVPKESFVSRQDGELKDVELMILIDRATASASEIFTAAMKEHGRAEIVGAESFGKGLILKRYDLGDESSILIAIAEYKTPNSNQIQRPYEGRITKNSSGGINPTLFIELPKVIDNEYLKRIREKIE